MIMATRTVSRPSANISRKKKKASASTYTQKKVYYKSGEGLGLGLNHMKTYQWVKIILGRYCYRRSGRLNRDKHINHIVSYYYSIPWRFGLLNEIMRIREVTVCAMLLPQPHRTDELRKSFPHIPLNSLNKILRV